MKSTSLMMKSSCHGIHAFARALTEMQVDKKNKGMGVRKLTRKTALPTEVRIAFSGVECSAEFADVRVIASLYCAL
jgi:hypothetical protein